MDRYGKGWSPSAGESRFGTGVVKQRFFSFVLVLSLILSGCISKNTSGEESVVSTTTIPSSTLLPTETSTPTPTKTLAPTATFIIPTPTLSLTPLPTLSFYKTEYLLYEAGNKCDMPCWWGIIPGLSKWPKTKQFIESLDPSRSFSIEKINPTTFITKSTQSEMYKWYVWLPNSDSSTAINLEVQNNLVTAIRVNQDLFTLFLPVHKFLELSGKPDKVLVHISDYDKTNSIYDATLYLVYEQKHILASYVYWGTETTNAVNLCLQHLSPQDMYLWSSGVELNKDYSNFKPLDEFSELNPNTFYERFKNKNHQCFEMSKDAWK
jgi:hypothetical protein